MAKTQAQKAAENEKKLREAREEADKLQNPLYSIGEEIRHKLDEALKELVPEVLQDFAEAEDVMDKRDTKAAVYRQVIAYWQNMEVAVNHPYSILQRKFEELKKRMDAPTREFAGTTGITKVPPNAELRGALEVLETRLDQMKDTAAEVISGSYGFKWSDVLEHHNVEEELWAEHKAAQETK